MSKVKIEIKSWFSGDVLFEYESDNATMKKAVEAAVDDNADLSGADLRDADLRDADLSGADLRDADLSGAAIYCSDSNFDVNYRRGYFLSLTNLEEIETEMHHDVKSCRRWSFTWKNVLRIKSWKLKPVAGSFEAVAKNVSAASKAIADGVKEQSNDEKCAQSETPGVKVGDRVAFKHGDEPAEALCGDVIATKGSEAVVEVSQLLGRRTFILPFDKLIVIPSKNTRAIERLRGL